MVELYPWFGHRDDHRHHPGGGGIDCQPDRLWFGSPERKRQAEVRRRQSARDHRTGMLAQCGRWRLDGSHADARHPGQPGCCGHHGRLSDYRPDARTDAAPRATDHAQRHLPRTDRGARFLASAGRERRARREIRARGRMPAELRQGCRWPLPARQSLPDVHRGARAGRAARAAARMASPASWPSRATSRSRPPSGPISPA